MGAIVNPPAALAEPVQRTAPAHVTERATASSRPAAAPVGTEATARVLNVLVAVVGLVLAAPVMAIIAVLIKLTSRGPVLYRQTRVGLDVRSPGRHPGESRRKHDIGGRPFSMYKFRTMRVDAERHSGAVWASKSDPRITWIGGYLRQFRLDELPQLWNVLRGEMNVVGPRPERPAIFADLRDRIPGYQLRQRTRPGITGHAQVNQEYDTGIESVRSKLAYDLDYIRNRGAWEDLRIMLKTLPVILFRRGGW